MIFRRKRQTIQEYFDKLDICDCHPFADLGVNFAPKRVRVPESHSKKLKKAPRVAGKGKICPLVVNRSLLNFQILNLKILPCDRVRSQRGREATPALFDSWAGFWYEVA